MRNKPLCYPVHETKIEPLVVLPLQYCWDDR